MYDLQESEQNNTSEFDQDNQQHLERIKQNYLDEIKTQETVKSWIESVMFNSFNVAMTLYLIHLGMGLIVASMAGFSLGSFPGFKMFTDAFHYDKDSGMNINGKLLTGFVKIGAAIAITFSCGLDYSGLEKMSRMASEFYNKDVETYEYANKPDNVSMETRFLITVGLAGVGTTLFLSLLKKDSE